MRASLLAGLLVTLLAAAGTAAAQRIESLTPGRRAFSMTARTLERGGDTGLGLWRVVSPERSQGFLVSVSSHISHNEVTQGSLGLPTTQSDVNVTVGPRSRHYLDTGSPLAPFVESGVDVGMGFARLKTGSGEGRSSTLTWSPRVGAQVAAGAEWFPLHSLSVAGEVGLRGSVSFQRTTTTLGDLDTHINGWGASLGTFASAITLQVYF